MAKYQAPYPRKGRITKPTSWARKPLSLVADVREIESLQEQIVQPVSFSRVLALVPFLHVWDDRRLSDGAIQVKITCDEWVNQPELDKIEKYLKEQIKPIDEDLAQSTSYSDRPLTQEDEDTAKQAVDEARARYPRLIVKPLQDPATKGVSADQSLKAMHRYPRRVVACEAAGIQAKNLEQAADEEDRKEIEEGEISDDSLFDADLTEADEESEIDGDDFRGSRLVDM